MKPGDKDGYGRYGYLDGDDERVLCHECGNTFVSVAAHANLAHGMSADEYRSAHGIPRRAALVAPEKSRRMSKAAQSRVGSEGWERMVAKRDPTAASHARTPDTFKLRGLDAQSQRERAKRNIKGVRKPVTRRCRACGGLIHGRKGSTCSPPVPAHFDLRRQEARTSRGVGRTTRFWRIMVCNRATIRSRPNCRSRSSAKVPSISSRPRISGRAWAW